MKVWVKGAIIGLLILIALCITNIGVIYTHNLIEKNQKIPYSEFPQGTWFEMKCPNGDSVELIDFKNSKELDGHRQRVVYCQEDEIFWILETIEIDPPDEYWSVASYYGPFEGGYIVRHLLKISGETYEPSDMSQYPLFRDGVR